MTHILNNHNRWKACPSVCPMCSLFLLTPAHLAEILHTMHSLTGADEFGQGSGLLLFYILNVKL